MQSLYVLVGSFLPALLNFLAIFFGVLSIDNNKIGQVFFIMAILFLAIDTFNFGTTKLFSIDTKFKFNELLIFDLTSGFLSSIFFIIIYFSSFYFEQVSLSIDYFLLFLIPLCFSLSYTPLGYFRTNNGNGIICIVQVFCSSLRLLGVYLCQTTYISIDDLVFFWLVVEALYGLSLFFIFFYKVRPVYNSRFKLSSILYFVYIKKSWAQNFFSMFGKHFDVVVLNFFFGPASVALYRPVKSIINFFFNFGNSLALVLLKKDSFVKVFFDIKFLFVFSISACLISGLLSFFISNINFIESKFVSEHLFLYFSLSLMSCVFVFINRFICLYMLRFLNVNYIVFLSLLDSIGAIFILVVACFVFNDLAGPLAVFLNSLIMFILYFGVVVKK